MARQSEQLEHEAEIARAQLANSLDELRLRLTPGEIVDEVVEYARDTPAADFARNLARDIRQSPLPLLVIFAGIVWAVIASAIAQSRATARKPVNAGMVSDAHTARTPAVEEWRVMPVDTSSSRRPTDPVEQGDWTWMTCELSRPCVTARRQAATQSIAKLLSDARGAIRKTANR